MYVVNEKDLKKHTFSAHGGEGTMDIGFAFSEFERFSNDNDSGRMFFGISRAACSSQKTMSQRSACPHRSRHACQ